MVHQEERRGNPRSSHTVIISEPSNRDTNRNLYAVRNYNVLFGHAWTPFLFLWHRIRLSGYQTRAAFTSSSYSLIKDGHNARMALRTNVALDKMIADSLSAGPYNLPSVAVQEVSLYRRQMPTIIESCLDNRCNQFKMIPEWNLGPLRMMRGLNVQFAGIRLPWANPTWCEIIIVESGHLRHVVLRLFSTMRRDVVRYLEGLAEEVPQNGEVRSRETVCELPTMGELGRPSEYISNNFFYSIRTKFCIQWGNPSPTTY